MIAPAGAPVTGTASATRSVPACEKQVTDDMTEGIVKLMGGLALEEEKTDFNVLVSAWIVSAERDYKASIDYSREVSERVIGYEPCDNADWQNVLLKMYGERQLAYLLSDEKLVGYEASLFPPRPDGRQASFYEKVFDWLQRSEAGFLRYAPQVDWSEVHYDERLQERPLEEHLALGVGTKYAVMIARAPKTRVWSVYTCDVQDCANAAYANNVEAAKFEEIVARVGLSTALKERLHGSVYAYSRSVLSVSELPESGFVSGDHLVLNWPNCATEDGPRDRVCVYTLPHCYTTEGEDAAGGAKRWHYEFKTPPGAVSSVCLLFPHLMFVTNTSLFPRIRALQRMSNYESVHAQLKAAKDRAIGERGCCDIIVAIDLTKREIYKVIPVLRGKVAHLSCYPRMTSPGDERIERKEHKILWNVMNAADPDAHGYTEAEFLYPELQGQTHADTIVEAGFYWSSPERELQRAEVVATQFKSPAVESPRGIYLFPGGHIVQLSEHNLSTFVARTPAGAFPTDAFYHGRDVSATDCAVYANLHVTLTGDGEVQFACLRVGEGDLIPKYTFTGRHLTVMGRKLPASVAKDAPKKSKKGGEEPTSNAGHYKAIWVSAAFRVVVQLSDGTLVSFRPKTLSELTKYLEEVAKAQALELAQRYTRRMTEKQLADAEAHGVEPESIAKARQDALASAAAAK